jgi:hypothetical protein
MGEGVNTVTFRENVTAMLLLLYDRQDIVDIFKPSKRFYDQALPPTVSPHSFINILIFKHKIYRYSAQLKYLQLL